jgi:hypothetical protein
MNEMILIASVCVAFTALVLIIIPIIIPKRERVLYEIKKSNLKYHVYKDGMFIESFDFFIEAIEKVDALKEQLEKEKEVTVYRKKIWI